MAGNKLKYADEVLKTRDGSVLGGFNSRVMGHSYTETLQSLTWGIGETIAGWQLADKMFRDGKIYAVHNFHHSHECRGFAFPYGGSFVCNECGRNKLAKDWWAVKCFADGNAWCCVGLEFEDLQASDCFAFGDTFAAAIAAYGDLMTPALTQPGTAQ